MGVRFPLSRLTAMLRDQYAHAHARDGSNNGRAGAGSIFGATALDTATDLPNKR